MHINVFLVATCSEHIEFIRSYIAMFRTNTSFQYICKFYTLAHFFSLKLKQKPRDLVSKDVYVLTDPFIHHQLRFPRCRPITATIERRYGRSTLQLYRRTEKLRFKIQKIDEDLRFLNTCKTYRIIPNFIKFKVLLGSFGLQELTTLGS